MSFCFGKVRTGTYNFVSVIWNSNPVSRLFAAVISDKTQFSDQVKISSISQLIDGIFKVSQNCLSVLEE